MKQKPKTPYQRLLEDVRKYVRKITYPHIRTMWIYPKAKLGTGWILTNLWERAQAADQLGYDVVLVANNDGLKVLYRKRPPDPNWNWTP